ncbi:MAG: hypothetical protein PHF21_01280 [Bacilli bacterium]|nr:hypothetical protein [Bacilli bacterium]
MKKNRLKNNYLNLFLILIGVVLLTIGSSNLYRNYSNNKVNQSYISKYIANLQLNEITNASLEFSANHFVYISYTGDAAIYNFEVKLKKMLKDKELIDHFAYIDATELLTNKDYISELNKVFNISKQKIKKLPVVIYYKDNEVTDFVDSKAGLIDVPDIVQLLEKYEISE